MLSRAALQVPRLAGAHTIRAGLPQTSCLTRLQSSNAWQQDGNSAAQSIKRREPHWKIYYSAAFGVAAGSAVAAAWIINKQNNPPSLDRYVLLLAEETSDVFDTVCASTQLAQKRLEELNKEVAARLTDGTLDGLAADKNARVREVFLSVKSARASLLQESFRQVR